MKKKKNLKMLSLSSPRVQRVCVKPGVICKEVCRSKQPINGVKLLDGLTDDEDVYFSYVCVCVYVLEPENTNRLAFCMAGEYFGTTLFCKLTHHQGDYMKGNLCVRPLFQTVLSYYGGSFLYICSY
jgi:hypothetical protein